MDAFSGVFTSAALSQALGILLKLGLAVVLGGAIGWERERHGRPAGIRTHMLIILGVTLICEVSKGFGDPSPARVAAGVITGIGFLGAGTILRIGPDVKGLTTAASIWAAAAIGMAVSVGGAFYIVAVGSTVLTLITLAWVDRFEKQLNPMGHPCEMLVTLTGRDHLPDLIRTLHDAGIAAYGFRIVNGDTPFEIMVDVAKRRESLLGLVMASDGVSAARWAD